MADAPASAQATTPSGPLKPSSAEGYVGLLVGNKYRITRVLGEGAMGAVLEGWHVELDKRVALKFLRQELLSRPDMVMRFDREAKAVARLHGEYVTKVLDVGNEAGVPFIVMEFLRGQSLAQMLMQSHPLSIEVAASLAIEACAGLAEAHAAGIIHRDIKPDNLFLSDTPEGTQRLKILDFGVSKVALTGAAFDASVVATDTMVGSPLYMSPEQVRAQSIDLRTDIWSLGVTLFEMLAGHPPFEAQTLPQACSLVLEAPIPDIRSLRADCPEGLAQIIRRCLQRERTDRFASAGDLAAELVVFASARAALAADTAVALSRRTARTGTDEPPVNQHRETSVSMLDLHMASRSPSGSHSFSQSSLNLPAVSQTGAPPKLEAPARSFLGPAVGGVILLLLGGTALWMRAPHAPPGPAATAGMSVASPTPSQAPSAVASAADSSAGVAPPPSASVSSEVAAPSASVTPSASGLQPAFRAPGPWKPSAPHPPAGHTAPPSVNTNDLDIRRTR